MLVITLDLIPISVNSLYRQFKGRTIISKEGREFKEDMARFLKGINTKPLIDGFIATEGLDVEIKFSSNRFYTKEGNIRKRFLDCDNLLKATLDTVFKEIGLDDSMITRLVVTKGRGVYDKTEISIKHNVNA